MGASVKSTKPKQRKIYVDLAKGARTVIDGFLAQERAKYTDEGLFPERVYAKIDIDNVISKFRESLAVLLMTRAAPQRIASLCDSTQRNQEFSRNHCFVRRRDSPSYERIWQGCRCQPPEEADARWRRAPRGDDARRIPDKDGAFERRFQQVIVKEPTVSETISILRGVKDQYEGRGPSILLQLSIRIVGLGISRVL